MTRPRTNDTVAQLLAVSAHEAGWDGRSAAAACAGSLVLATAFAVEARQFGLDADASLSAAGDAVLTFGDGPRRASVQFHADGVAGAFVTCDGTDWDCDVTVDDPVARRRLALRIAEALAGVLDAPRTVSVRQLDWSGEERDKGAILHAETVLGRYLAWDHEGKGYMVPAGSTAASVTGRTVDDAKAAAQADFDRRIRAQLEP